jgi:hypothetical protein
MKDLQTVLDELIKASAHLMPDGYKHQGKASSIIEQMMQGEPVAVVKWQIDGLVVHIVGDVKEGDMLYTAPQTASEWQPIESAPKDGTRVLLRGYGATFVAGFEKVIGCDFYGWVVANDIHIEPKHATHWMPLTSAPKDASVTQFYTDRANGCHAAKAP